MVLKAQVERLGETKWWEYLVRFIFGGLVTVVAGAIAKEFGAVVGGLFLAFPGIFPASVTLVERHEKEKKQRHGFSGVRRGRMLSAVIALGAALGSIGLLAFSGLAAWLLPRSGAWQALGAATLGWLALSVLAWMLRRHLRDRAPASVR